jgi:hypothetical protein
MAIAGREILAALPVRRGQDRRSMDYSAYANGDFGPPRRRDAGQRAHRLLGERVIEGQAVEYTYIFPTSQPLFFDTNSGQIAVPTMARC